MKTLALCLIMIVACGCSTTKAPRRPSPQDTLLLTPFQRLLHDASGVLVDLSDGISEVEAYRIAWDLYVLPDSSEAALLYFPIEEKLVWRVPLLEKYHGTQVGAFVVRKKDGFCVTEGIASRMLKQPNKAPEPTP